nr:hypothetical protein [Tanacetum cinerariifolium]
MKSFNPNNICVEDINKGAEACSFQLYDSFVGTSMDYKIVNASLNRMWRVYGIDGTTKTNSREPGIWLEKVEPSTIPIWVCVYNGPIELYNGNGIGKIMSGV